MSRDWKSRGHTRLSLRLAGALAEPVSGGGSVASLHLEKALRAWPNAIRKCAAVSDLRRRLWAEGRRPVPGPGTARSPRRLAPAAPPHTPRAARCPPAAPPASARPRHPKPAFPAGASPWPLALQALETHRPGGRPFRRSRLLAAVSPFSAWEARPRKPPFSGVPPQVRVSPARGEPRTSLPECSRSPRSVPTRGLRAAARISAPSWRPLDPRSNPLPLRVPQPCSAATAPSLTTPGESLPSTPARSSRHPPCAVDASGTCSPGGAGRARAAERRAGAAPSTPRAESGTRTFPDAGLQPAAPQSLPPPSS